MTESQWLASTEPKKLLKYLHKRSSERKRRLFAVACCRRAWQHFKGGVCHGCLQTAEQYADGLTSGAELLQAETEALEAFTLCRDAGDEPGTAATDAVYAATCSGVGWDFAEVASSRTVAAVVAATSRDQAKAAKAAEVAAQVALVRDVFGNPFRPVKLNPQWLTATVTAIARGIYDDRSFSQLPILADALQDACCDRDELLSHFRDPAATHVRGCWALDLALGRE